MKTYKPVIMAAQTLPIVGLVLMSPVLPAVAEEFPQVGTATIQMMVTLPAICSLVFSQVSGWLSNFMDKRRIILTGLFFYVLGGLGAYFTVSFWQLFVCRLLLGCGIGLFAPVNMSLITDFCRGEETQTIGLAQAVNYICGAVGTILAGILAATYWRNVFLVNLLAVAVFVVDLLWLPSCKNDSQTASRKYQVLPLKVYLLMLFACAQMLVFYSCVTNFAARTLEIGVSGSFSASIGIALLYVGCFLTGLVLVRLQRRLGRWLIIVALALSGAGFLLMSSIPVIEVLYFGIICVGLGDGIILPYLFAGSAVACPVEYSGQAIATINLGVSVGQFLGPLFFAGVKLLAGTDTVQSGFRGLSVAILILVAGSALYVSLSGRKKRSGQPRTCGRA